MTINLLDYPATEGRPVTEGHAKVCADRGHATWTQNGEDTGVCPRCGEVTETPCAGLQRGASCPTPAGPTGWCNRHLEQRTAGGLSLDVAAYLDTRVVTR